MEFGVLIGVRGDFSSAEAQRWGGAEGRWGGENGC